HVQLTKTETNTGQTVTVETNTTAIATGQIGNNFVAYVANQGSNTLSLIRSGTINSPKISYVTGTGDINAVQMGTGAIAATTGGSGNINIASLGTATVGATSAGGNVQVSSAGNMTVS